MRHLLCATLLFACSAGKSSVEVSLEGQAQGVTAVAITVENGGKTSAPVSFPLASATDIPPAQTLALVFDSSRSGAVTVHVQAMAGATVVATGSGSGSIAPGAQAGEIHVTLTPTVTPMPDMALASDLSTSEADLSPPPDLAPVSSPLLKGVFVAGGGAATQGAVTLNGRFYWQGAATIATNGSVTLTGWFQ